MFIWRQLFPPNVFFGIMCLSDHPWPPFFSPFLIPLPRGWFWVVHREGLPSLVHDSQVFPNTLRPLTSPVTAIRGENELIWEGNQLLCTNGKGQIRLSGPLLSSKRTHGQLTGASGGHCCVCCSTQMGWDEWWELGLRGKSYKGATAQRDVWGFGRLRPGSEAACLAYGQSRFNLQSYFNFIPKQIYANCRKLRKFSNHKEKISVIHLPRWMHFKTFLCMHLSLHTHAHPFLL